MKINDQKPNNMKNLFFIAAFVFIFCGCKKDEPASLEIEVSYYYNQYQGYKPDIGAKAYLFTEKQTKTVWIDSISPTLAQFGKLTDKSGTIIDVRYQYKGEAGVSGMLNITGIEPGSYLLILASKGRYTFTHKHIDFNSGEALSLVKNFGYLYDYEFGGESW